MFMLMTWLYNLKSYTSSFKKFYERSKFGAVGSVSGETVSDRGGSTEKILSPWTQCLFMSAGL